MQRLTRRATVLLGLLLAGCVSPTAKLLDEDDLASDRRIRRLNLTVEVPDGSGGWMAAAQEEPIGAVASWADDHCWYLVQQEPSLNTCTASGDPCGIEACEAQIQLCSSLLLREMASSVAPVVLMSTNGVDVYRVPSQDAESRAALEQAAQRRAAAAVHTAGNALRPSSAVCSGVRLLDHVGAASTSTSSPTTVLPQTTGEFLAATMVEALEVAEDAVA